MPTLFAQNSPDAMARRKRLLMEGCGYFAETSDLPCAAATALAATQTVYGMAVGLLGGDVVTNMTVGLQTIGVSVTLMKVGIYTKTGTLLASSADQSSVMNGTTGFKTITLTNQANGQPLTIPSDDLYYAALLAVGAGTQPTLLQPKGALNTFQAINSASSQTVVQTGQTDLPASATFTATSAGRTFWIALS